MRCQRRLGKQCMLHCHLKSMYPLSNSKEQRTRLDSIDLLHTLHNYQHCCYQGLYYMSQLDSWYQMYFPAHSMHLPDINCNYWMQKLMQRFQPCS